jgi:hypothetical protein
MSESGVQGYRHPGDVEILSASFITSNGNVVDISDLIDGINVYQNIFRHYMECEIAIYDASKFLHNLPYYPEQNFTGGFSGTEIFILSYRNRSKNSDVKQKVYTHSFRLYSVKDRQSVNNAEVYLFSGISEEAYQTQASRISSALGGTSGSTTKSMIEGIFKRYFKSPEVKSVYEDLRKISSGVIDKKLNTMETIGIQKYIIPNLTVDDTIRFLLRESDCATRIPYFLFYEDSENYNFSNVNGLTTQDPVDEYWYSHKNSTVDKEDMKIQDAKTIISYKLNRQFDLFDNLNNGLYISKTIKLDMLKKNKKEVTYDYSKYASKFNKLQNKIVQGVAGGKEPIVTMMTTRNGHDSDPIFSSENPKPKRIENIKDIKNSFRSAVFNTSIEVLIPANPSLKVGQTIKLNFPVDTDEAKGLEIHDKYLTGKYLITKVRQIFTKTEMTTVLECTKDGGIA